MTSFGHSEICAIYERERETQTERNKERERETDTEKENETKRETDRQRD